MKPDREAIIDCIRTIVPNFDPMSFERYSIGELKLLLASLIEKHYRQPVK